MTGLHPELPHILLLFSDTGGGHRSAAQAIIEALNKEFPDQFTVEMVDIFRFYTPLPLNKAPEIYPYLTRFPDMWGFNYHISDGKRRVRTASNFMLPYLYRDLRRLLREHPADLIVSLHWFAIAPVLNVMWRTRTPLIPVVLDLVSTHAAWFDPRATHTIVPTQVAFQKGMEMGVDFDKMTVIGLPVAERFCKPEGDKTALRQQLGWSTDRSVILLVGGGEGMGPLEDVAHEIYQANLPVLLAIVTGRNRSLKERLE
ncbi:MAG TPA: galactosyldiacylglycerol synthase, partial [Longilinea sp.]|nr:galactosyldiacylglycerol synthase [Longilinea sp.]